MWFLWRNNKSNGDSEAALKDARKNVREVRERDQEVTKVVKALRDIRERNHFAEQMEEIIRRRGSFR